MGLRGPHSHRGQPVCCQGVDPSAVMFDVKLKTDELYMNQCVPNVRPRTTINCTEKRRADCESWQGLRFCSEQVLNTPASTATC